MFEVNEEIKTFVTKKQSLLKPLAILKMVDDIITDMLSLGIPKKSILTHINDELSTDIKYSTFLKYVNNKKGFRRTRPAVKQTSGGTERKDSDTKATGADDFINKLTGDTQVV